jgi:hypothetical protein
VIVPSLAVVHEIVEPSPAFTEPEPGPLARAVAETTPPAPRPAPPLAASFVIVTLPG